MNVGKVRVVSATANAIKVRFKSGRTYWIPKSAVMEPKITAVMAEGSLHVAAWKARDLLQELPSPNNTTFLDRTYHALLLKYKDPQIRQDLASLYLAIRQEEFELSEGVREIYQLLC